MSGSNAPNTSGSSTRSSTRHPPKAAATDACDPHSVNASTRTCGNALAFAPVSSRPNSVTLSSASGTSSMNPSTAISRRERSHAPFVPPPRHRGGDPFEQHPQRLSCQPLPGLRDRRGRRHLPVIGPRIHLLKRPDELTHHFLIVIVVEQAHRHTKPHHHMRRQPPRPPLPPTSLIQHILDHIPPNNLRQHPQRDRIRQPHTVRSRLHHTRTLTTPTPTTKSTTTHHSAKPPRILKHPTRTMKHTPSKGDPKDGIRRFPRSALNLVALPPDHHPAVCLAASRRRDRQRAGASPASGRRTTGHGARPDSVPGRVVERAVRDTVVTAATVTAARSGTKPCTRPGALQQRFPPRPVAVTWPQTRLLRPAVLERLVAAPFTADTPVGEDNRRRGLRMVLDWLQAQPGQTWQQRWLASGADSDGSADWRSLPIRWRKVATSSDCRFDAQVLGTGLLSLICADVIRPGLTWLLTTATPKRMATEMARTRDPGGFADLTARCHARPVGEATTRVALHRIAALMAAKGGLVGDITVGDCLQLLDLAADVCDVPHYRSPYFYQLLHAVGAFGGATAPTVRALNGDRQLSVEQLIDRCGIA